MKTLTKLLVVFLLSLIVACNYSDDVDGSYADYTGPNAVIRKLPLDKSGAPKYHFLEGDGVWGGHWNLNILWPLVYPEYGNWMAETFLEYYRNAGILEECF